MCVTHTLYTENPMFRESSEVGVEDAVSYVTLGYNVTLGYVTLGYNVTLGYVTLGYSLLGFIMFYNL